MLICSPKQGLILLISYGTKASHVVFCDHVDNGQAECRDALHPRAENGKVQGREAADMKGGIVALLCTKAVPGPYNS